MKTAIYPGTFDPITLGHLDIIERAVHLFDRVVVTVAKNTKKAPLFDAAERVEMIRSVCADMKNVEVDSFDGLIVDYAKRKNASALIRGLRVISDFEYEFQMALVNRKLAPQLATVFMMPGEKYTYLNSTIVKEIALFDGPLTDFVPPSVADRVRAKLAKKEVNV
jgi:pantetheine-phosphate adenylyltransferase